MAAIAFPGPSSTDGDLYTGLHPNQVKWLKQYEPTVTSGTGSYNSISGSTGGSVPSQVPDNAPTPNGPNTLYDDFVVSDLPPWLRPQALKSNVRELKNTYNSVSGAYDVSDTVSALLGLANLQQGQSAQTGDAAVREATSRAAQTGGYVNSSALRASVQLPALQNRMQAEVAARGIEDEASQKAIGAKTELASALATLRQNYANMLANFSTDREKTLQQGDQFNRQLAEGQNEFNAKLQFDQKQASEDNDIKKRQLAIQELAARSQAASTANFATNYNISPSGQPLTGADGARQALAFQYLQNLIGARSPV